MMTKPPADPQAPFRTIAIRKAGCRVAVNEPMTAAATRGGNGQRGAPRCPPSTKRLMSRREGDLHPRVA
jgi:hypothetical protein